MIEYSTDDQQGTEALENLLNDYEKKKNYHVEWNFVPGTDILESVTIQHTTENGRAEEVELRNLVMEEELLNFSVIEDERDLAPEWA